eukprot:5912231-Amphidinium_carterae.2
MGKRGRQGHCDERSSLATRSPLEREMNTDEEDFFCKVGQGTSFCSYSREDVETSSLERVFGVPKKHLGVTRAACPESGEHPAVSVVLNNDREEFSAAVMGDAQLPTANREDVNTCTTGGFSGEPKLHSGVARVAPPSRREHA